MLVRAVTGAVLLFLLLQLIRPHLANLPATAELQAPAAVTQILKQSCYACHSNEVHLSWFDEIVPAYWLVVHDVKAARRRLNFSQLGAQPAATQRAALFETVNFIQMDTMPLTSYTHLHPAAVVSSSQLAILREYLLPKSPATVSKETVEAAGLEYRKWTSNSGKPVGVQPSPNGIAFLPEYKNWKVIGSTCRFDANTLRIILGNDVAIKAIADHTINPWPDGTTFAKVGWLQQPDAHGVMRAGAFLKIGFMIKDKVRYASTAGWGWAEWVGAELKPYGNGPGFADECVSCHAPLEKNDYVYTMPIRYLGGAAR